MNTADIKQMIIENFIDYSASDDAERERLNTLAADYVNQDHVDEIGQALGCENGDEVYCTIEVVGRSRITTSGLRFRRGAMYYKPEHKHQR